jgi:hypothetical protein
MDLQDQVLAVGATMRLTRLVVTDDLGQWWVKDPIDRLFHPREVGEQVDGGEPWAGPIAQPPQAPAHLHRYVGGLDCPFCVGFWIGAAVLVGYHVLPRGLWRFGTRALTLNEVAAHAGVRLND